MRVAIIGNGITGVSAALSIRRLRPDWEIVMISGESDFHYSRPALMYIFMGHMSYRDTKPYEDGFWRKNRIDLVRGWVAQIDAAGKKLVMSRGEPVSFDRLLIATGSKPNRFGWPGQDLGGVQGFYGLMDLGLLYENVKGARSAAVVGGGLIGIELAEMLHSRNIRVTFLVREKSYWSNVLPPEESRMINDVIRERGIDLRLETELREIVDDGSGRAKGIVTGAGEFVECQVVGLTAGVSPNVSLARSSGIGTARGVLVDRSFRTDAPDVFAAGDCAEIATEGEEKNLVQQVWYTGKAQGRVAGEAIAGERAVYEPGIWYNSAKFFDLEYQTYGTVASVPAEGESGFYWEHPDGRRSIRIVTRGGVLSGINVMGLRYRHEVCESWVAEKRSLDYVLDNLSEANFDPEFCGRYEEEIIREIKKQAA